MPLPKDPEKIKIWKEKQRKAHLGQIPWSKGKFLSEEHKRKISLSERGKEIPDDVRRRTSETCKRNGVGKWMAGRKSSPETIKKRSLSHSGEKHWNWKGGISKTWRKRNKELTTMYVRRRRVRKKGTSGSHSLREWLELKKKCHFQCVRCYRREPDIKLTEDHIVPLSLNGSDYIDNIQPLCLGCNSKKHAKEKNYLISYEQSYFKY